MRNLRMNVSAVALCAAVVFGLSFAPARADTVTFNLDTEFSSGTPPAGPTPWVTATFTDALGGGVDLLISAVNLVATEFISEFSFNIDPSAVGLAITHIAGDTAPGASVGQGSNQFKADGDGYFDVLLDYPPPGSDRFGAGETSTWHIAGTAVANIVNALSCAVKNGVGAACLGTGFPKDGLHVAAHIQSIGPNGANSGWITGGPSVIPIPPAAVLFFTGLVGMGMLKRRRHNGTGLSPRA